MLTRLYVDNFRCLVNFDCQFGPQQLVLGANGAGKSSVFDVLSLLRDFCVTGEPPDRASPAPRFGGPTLTRWQKVPEQTFELDVKGNSGAYSLRLVIDAYGTPERPRVILEEVKFNSKTIFKFEKGEVHLFNDKAEKKVNYPFDWNRSALATITERPENTKLTWFKRWLGGILCVQPNPWSMRGIALDEAARPDEQLSNFADWYRHLRQETNDHEYIVDLRQVIEGFQSIRLESAGEGRREIKVRLSGVGSNNGSHGETEYLLNELSEGQRVLIGLYAILHFALKPGALLCFDEPDNFIALREVQPWLEKVIEQVEHGGAGAQVLIASHHPEVLNRMAFKEGLLLDRPEGRHVRVQKFGDSQQTGLSAAELLARGWEL
jgi:hypothetical protein